MNNLLSLGIIAGLLFIWRKSAAAADMATPAAADMATPAAAAGNALAQVDVTNHTSETQNTLTLGTDSRTNIGGALVLGGAGGAGGLNAGSGGGTGGTNNNTSVTQNTTTLGNNAVLHYGSGRRPARTSDFEDFLNANANHRGFIGPGYDRSLGQLANSAAELESSAKDGSLKAARYGVRPDWQGPSLYDQIAALWNNFFGNSVAFPGQPIN